MKDHTHQCCYSMYSVVVVFPETGRHDGSSVSGEIARKFRSENFWDFTKSMDFFLNDQVSQV